jgi:hypothetical protein
MCIMFYMQDGFLMCFWQFSKIWIEKKKNKTIFKVMRRIEISGCKKNAKTIQHFLFFPFSHLLQRFS